MSGSLSTEKITDGDRLKVTAAVPGELWFWQDADRRVLFASLVRRCGKHHAAKVKPFFVSRGQYVSSVSSYTIILPRQMSFFLNIAHLKTLCPLLNLSWNNRLLMLLSVQYCITRRQKTVKICVYKRRYWRKYQRMVRHCAKTTPPTPL